MLVNRVLIVGAGIGGLALGAALGRRGVEVDIIEIKANSEVLGVGINQPSNSLRALRSLGVLDGCLQAGFQFDRMRFHDKDGGLIVEVPSGTGQTDVPANNALSRADLQRLLLQAVESGETKISYSTTVSDLTDDGDRVAVEMSDGRTGIYDLVVGFDGVKSPIRRRIFGDAHEPVYSGYGVWRITLPRAEGVDCVQAFQGVGTKAGVIPLNQKEMYLFHVTAEPGNPRLDPSRFAEMLRERLEGYTGLVAEIRQAITSSDGIVYSPLMEVMLPSPWFKGRVIVLGDAAHACAPHLTQGAAMALEDAVVLAEELATAGPVNLALESFMQRRYQRCKLVQDVSHGILTSEMAIDADNMDVALAHMRTDLAAQMAGVDAILGQPA